MIERSHLGLLEQWIRRSGDAHAERLEMRFLETPDAQESIGLGETRLRLSLEFRALRNREPSPRQRLNARHVSYALHIHANGATLADCEQDEIARVTHVEVTVAGDDGPTGHR